MRKLLILLKKIGQGKMPLPVDGYLVNVINKNISY
jgi:hypothetical protein